MISVKCVLHKIEIAQAFDELSILEIKKSKLINQKQKKLLEKQINVLKDEILLAVGSVLMEKIYHSDFYKNLFNTNLDIFISVDKFKTSEPAQLNMKRIDAKRKLQEYFFGKVLEEIKI